MNGYNKKLIVKARKSLAFLTYGWSHEEIHFQYLLNDYFRSFVVGEPSSHQQNCDRTNHHLQNLHNCDRIANIEK